MQLLLEAAVLDKPKALISWRTYLTQNNLQEVGHTDITLFPLVYRNLKGQSHPLCKSIYRHTWASNQTLWAKTLPFLQKLNESGIEKIVLLKGMALVLHHYRDFGARVMGDIDILIDRKYITQAFSTLLKMGWICTMPRFNPENPHQLHRWNGVNLTHTSGLNLDLHWSFLLESNLELDREIINAQSPGIQPLEPTALFFQTCIHGNKKSTAPLIRWIPDALTLLQSSIDFTKLFTMAKNAHLTLPLSRALSHLSTNFGAPVPQMTPEPTTLEIRELNANLKGNIYLAAYFRSRMRNRSLFHYLQHTANLPSLWLVFPYIPYWILKRIYRLIKGIL
jgi:hypothetical protein